MEPGLEKMEPYTMTPYLICVICEKPEHDEGKVGMPYCKQCCGIHETLPEDCPKYLHKCHVCHVRHLKPVNDECEIFKKLCRTCHSVHKKPLDMNCHQEHDGKKRLCFFCKVSSSGSSPKPIGVTTRSGTMKQSSIRKFLKPATPMDEWDSAIDKLM